MDVETVETREIGGLRLSLGTVLCRGGSIAWDSDPERGRLIVNLGGAMTAFDAAAGPRLYLGAPSWGEFSWVPPGMTFHGRYGPGTLRFLSIEPPAAWSAPRWPRLAAFDLAVAQGAVEIARRLAADRTESVADRAGALWRHLLDVEPRPRTRRGAALSDARFVEVQHALDAEPTRLRSARDLAAWCGTSLDGLDRGFLDAFGLSTAAYLDAARLRRARRLLCTSDRTASAIAVASGFASEAHMSDRMLARLGLRPSALRVLVRRHAAPP